MFVSVFSAQLNLEVLLHHCPHQYVSVKAEETKELHKAIAKVLCEEPTQVKGLDGFLLRLRDALERLEYRERSKN